MAEEYTKIQFFFTLIIPLIFLMSFRGHAQNVIFPDTIRACNADSLLLDAGQGYDTYTWSTGDTGPVAWVFASGDYSLNVTQGDTVDQTDEFYVVLVSAGIQQDNTSITCGDTLVLSGSSDLFSYFWTNVNSGEDSISVYPRDTTMFFAKITDPMISYHYCFDSVEVVVEPIIFVDTTIQQSIGCPGENKAKIKLEVSGGNEPLEYEWPPEAIPLFEDPSFAIGLRDGDKTVTITDAIGCYINHDFYVKAHRLPEMELFSEPEDTVYIQNPYVTYTYENPLYDSLGVDTFYLAWWEWNFGDSAKSTALSPTHIYQTPGEYTVELKYKTFFECFGSDTLRMLVRPVDLLFPAVITPNGDFLNDTFEIWEGTASAGGEEEGGNYKSVLSMDPIDLSKYYISNSLVIFNKWGEKVYEADNYQNDWDGGGLNDGMYYYVFKCVGEHESKSYKGSLLILTGNSQ